MNSKWNERKTKESNTRRPFKGSSLLKQEVAHLGDTLPEAEKTIRKRTTDAILAKKKKERFGGQVRLEETATQTIDFDPNSVVELTFPNYVRVPTLQSPDFEFNMNRVYMQGKRLRNDIVGETEVNLPKDRDIDFDSYIYKDKTPGLANLNAEKCAREVSATKIQSVFRGFIDRKNEGRLKGMNRMMKSEFPEPKIESELERYMREHRETAERDIKATKKVPSSESSLIEKLRNFDVNKQDLMIEKQKERMRDLLKDQENQKPIPQAKIIDLRELENNLLDFKKQSDMRNELMKELRETTEDTKKKTVIDLLIGKFDPEARGPASIRRLEDLEQLKTTEDSPNPMMKKSRILKWKDQGKERIKTQTSNESEEIDIDIMTVRSNLTRGNETGSRLIGKKE